MIQNQVLNSGFHCLGLVDLAWVIRNLSYKELFETNENEGKIFKIADH